MPVGLVTEVQARDAVGTLPQAQRDDLLASVELGIAPSYPQILRQGGERESLGSRQQVVPHTLQHWEVGLGHHELSQALWPLLRHETQRADHRQDLETILSVRFTQIQWPDQLTQDLQHWLDSDPDVTFEGRVLLDGVRVGEGTDGQPFQMMPATVVFRLVHRWVEAGTVPAPGVQHDGRQRFQGGMRLYVTVREEGETNLEPRQCRLPRPGQGCQHPERADRLLGCGPCAPGVRSRR